MFADIYVVTGIVTIDLSWISGFPIHGTVRDTIMTHVVKGPLALNITRL